MDVNMMSSDELAALLGARLKNRRLSLSMTQDELAKRAGLAVGTIKNLEARASASTLDSTIRITLALGMADQFEQLFATKPRSIAQMEQLAAAPRLRARRSRRT